MLKLKDILMEVLLFDFHGKLKKGAKLKIISLHHTDQGGRKDSYEKGKYSSIMFDFYMGDKLIHRDPFKNQMDLAHRFTISRYDNKEIYDFSKFLKKV